jgi:hypothetical protein
MPAVSVPGTHGARIQGIVSVNPENPSLPTRDSGISGFPSIPSCPASVSVDFVSDLDCVDPSSWPYLAIMEMEGTTGNNDGSSPFNSVQFNSFQFNPF